MTKEEKAQAYDEALDRMKHVVIVPKDEKALQALKETIFPELAESEDEKIRKILLKMAKVPRKEIYEHEGITKDRAIAYLEKQKEQKPADLSTMMVHKEPYIAPVPTPMVADEQKPVKPSGKLSRQDYLYQLLIDQLISYSDYEYLIEHKPAEWSEEDKDMLNSCISSIEEAKENRYAYKETDGDTSYDHEIAWLKSLRHSWKPSEEQMQALEYVISDYREDGCNATANYLQEILDHLKNM